MAITLERDVERHISSTDIAMIYSSFTPLDLDESTEKRIEQVQRFRDYYSGNFYPYQDEVMPKPYVNLCFKLVEKLTTWLVGKPPVVKARKDIHPIIEEIYEDTLENSGGESFYSKAVREGGITGDSFVFIGYDEDVQGSFFRIMPSDKTVVQYNNIGRENKLSKVKLYWSYLNTKNEVVDVEETWEDDNVFITPPIDVVSVTGINANQSGRRFEAQDGSDYLVFENPYDEIPFVHIRNIDAGGSIYGRSDIHDIWSLNLELNEQLLHYRDNVDYTGDPITLIYGASALDIVKSSDGIWSNLPTEARVDTLKIESTHPQIVKYIEILKEFFGFSMLPTEFLGGENVIKSDTSAVAMQMGFMPLLEIIRQKEINYGRGFKECFEKAVRYVDKFNSIGLSVLNAPTPKAVAKLDTIPDDVLNDDQKIKLMLLRELPFYHTEVSFTSYLPQNYTKTLADAVVGIQNKLEDIPSALQKLGVRDIEDKIVKIDQTQELLNAWNAESQAVQSFIQNLNPEAIGQQDVSSVPDNNQDFVDGVSTIEENTNQSSDRTISQRVFSGSGQF